jgi:SSS family solute:Na+ symporter/sodium/pantothenate symporter
MALWICSYMVVPLTTMALLGKRLNQMGRLTGAVTVPDVLRDRFRSPALGILSTLLILLFLCFNLVAQFKAGGLVMQAALRLQPAEATFDRAEPDKDRNLVLHFRLPDGRTEVQKTPLPHEEARYLPEQTAVDAEARQVEVFFQVGERTLSKKVKFPAEKVSVPVLWPPGRVPVETGYVLGLVVFALTVVGYTTYGGFWAVTWTDVLEGVVMLIGVLVMAVLAVRAVQPVEVERRVGTAVVKEEVTGLAAATERLRQQDPELVRGPGPKGFLPLGLAFSFFLMWSLMAAGQPSGMVRLMSFKDTPSLRRALLLVCFYYVLTYLALLVIFVCARAIFPTEYLRDVGSEGVPDRIMPEMARHLAPPLVAGLLLAAPYAAIMSTVAAFLLMISSSLVRDLWQRTFNPNVSDRTIKVASYAITGTIGVVVTLFALNPPDFLQYIIVFTGSGQGCSFLIPMAMALYWRRATRAGVLAGMLGGFLAVIALYVGGWVDSRTQATVREYREQRQAAESRGEPAPAPPQPYLWMDDNLKALGWGEKRPDSFAPLYAGGVDPLVWGLLASLALGVGVSLLTRPDEELVRKYFP